MPLTEMALADTISEDWQDLNIALQVAIIGVVAYVGYTIYNAIKNGVTPSWLPQALQPAPIGSGPQGSTPTNSFWSGLECILTLGQTCPDSGGGSASTGSSVWNPNDSGPSSDGAGNTIDTLNPEVSYEGGG